MFILFSVQNFALIGKPHLFTNFPATPSTTNFDFVLVQNSLILEAACIFNFLVFFEELLDVATRLTSPKGSMARSQIKWLVLSIES
jgi:hypothetical protein